MRFQLISDNIDTLVGMRLAGIEGVVVHEEAEVRQALKEAKENSEIGIVLITEGLMKLCPEVILDMKLTSHRPLIVQIPDRHGSARPPDSIMQYVREAIGVKI